jgi:tetratricopeptide (TPR) repeat protein
MPLEIPMPKTRMLLAVWFALVLGMCALSSPRQDEAAPSLAAIEALIRAEDWAAAIPALEKFTEADPEEPRGWFFLGYVLHMSGDLDRALVVHLKAATFEMVRPVALYNIACVHSRQGRVDESLEFLGKAREVGFADIAGMRADGDLEATRKDPRFADVLRAFGVAEDDIPKYTIDLAALPPERRFDFLAGEWERFTGSGSQGKSSAKYTLNYQAIRLEDAVGATTLSYDLGKQVWHSTEVLFDGRQVWSSGKFDGERMVLTSSDYPNARFVYHDVTATEFHWSMQGSQDGFVTWDTLGWSRFVRTKRQERPHAQTLAAWDEPDDHARAYAFRLGTWALTGTASVDGESLSARGSLVCRVDDFGKAYLDEQALKLPGRVILARTNCKRLAATDGQWQLSTGPGKRVGHTISFEPGPTELVTGTDEAGAAFLDRTTYEIHSPSHWTVRTHRTLVKSPDAPELVAELDAHRILP